jgi:hypothetical protein
MRKTSSEILLRLLLVVLATAVAMLLLAMFMTVRAFAALDPLTPIPDDCTLVPSWIERQDMQARMAAQHHGAVSVQSGALADGTRLELYYDATDQTWFNTKILRTRTVNVLGVTAWSTKKTSPTCLFAYGDPVPMPVVPAGVVPR